MLHECVGSLISSKLAAMHAALHLGHVGSIVLALAYLKQVQCLLCTYVLYHKQEKYAADDDHHCCHYSNAYLIVVILITAAMTTTVP